MRHLSYYKEYPIYEPAEGGYYYAGNGLAFSERLSKRAAKRKMKEIWKECQAENVENGFVEGTRWDVIASNTKIYPWIISDNGNEIWRESYYVGHGESYAIERHKGSRKRGWMPYC